MVDAADRDPSDRELREYVQYRLRQIGAPFAEPEFVEEAVTFQSDLWSQLYDIDRSFATGYFAP